MALGEFCQNETTKIIKNLIENPSKCVTTSKRFLNENRGQFTQHNFLSLLEQDLPPKLLKVRV